MTLPMPKIELELKNAVDANHDQGERLHSNMDSTIHGDCFQIERGLEITTNLRT